MLKLVKDNFWLVFMGINSIPLLYLLYDLGRWDSIFYCMNFGIFIGIIVFRMEKKGLWAEAEAKQIKAYCERIDAEQGLLIKKKMDKIRSNEKFLNRIKMYNSERVDLEFDVLDHYATVDKALLSFPFQKN